MKNLTSHHDQAKYKSFILMMHLTYYFNIKVMAIHMGPNE